METFDIIRKKLEKDLDLKVELVDRVERNNNLFLKTNILTAVRPVAFFSKSLTEAMISEVVLW